MVKEKICLLGIWFKTRSLFLSFNRMQVKLFYGHFLRRQKIARIKPDVLGGSAILNLFSAAKYDRIAQNQDIDKFFN